MTERIYDKDAYRREFDAKVISCRDCGKGYEVVLDRTAFYPEGGGQPCDLGTLRETDEGREEARVLDVQEADGEVVHTCSRPFAPGSRVCGAIDWQRRITHMREHSGEHVLSGIICRSYDCSNIGFHMGKDCITVDFSRRLTEGEIEAAVEAANKKVLEDVEIRAWYPGETALQSLEYRSKKELEGAVRIVEIPGADVCACCGTHVRRTGEIGPIRVIGKEHYKNGIRLTLLVGEKALADYGEKSAQAAKISALLSVPVERIGEGVEKLWEEFLALKTEYTAFRLKWLESRVGSVQGERLGLVFEEGLTPVEVRKLADRIQQTAQLSAVFSGTEEGGYQYVICSRTMDVAALGREFNRALSGRGGGKNPMIQGSVKAKRERIETFLRGCFAEKTDYSDRKIVFFDIDGTLLDNATHRVPESAAQAIRRLRSNGHLAFINTGRTLTSLPKELRALNFDGFVCGCGTNIYYGEKNIFSHSIPHEKCVEIVKKLRDLKITAFFESPEYVWFDGQHPVKNPEAERSKIAFSQNGSNVQDFPRDLEGSGLTFDKFYCLLTQESDRAGLEEYIRGEFTATPQGEDRLEVVPEGCTKAEGIRFLQKKFGIRLENCYAIGDGENDIPMLEAVANGIAMGECSEKILPYCVWQTARVSEDGIQKALEHFGLI